jgi:O-antigen ligase
MAALLRDRVRRANTLGLGLIAAFGIVAAFASVELAGTKTGMILAMASTIGPALLYAMLTAPISFPFSVYILLVPFDSILDLPAFGTLTKLLGIASAAALLFYMIRTKRMKEPPRATALWLLLFLWMTASLFWAIDVPSAQNLLPTSLSLFGLYVVVSMLPLNIAGLRQIVAAVIAGGVASAVYGVYFFHSGAGVNKDRLFIRTDTSAMNPDHFANSLVLPVALCLVALLWTRSVWVRIFCGAGLGIMLYTVVLTGSRGAMLGIGAVVFYLIWRDRHRWTIASLLAALGAIVIAVTGPAHFVERWALAAQNGGAGRMSIWNTGIVAFKENWLFGAGYANFPFAYDHAFMQTFQPFYANWNRASHNILLGTAVELGSVGLILLVLAWIGQFRLLRSIPAGDMRYPLRLALEGAVIGLFVCGFFADIMIWKYVWLAFMLVVLTRNATIPMEKRPHA